MTDQDLMEIQEAAQNRADTSQQENPELTRSLERYKLNAEKRAAEEEKMRIESGTCSKHPGNWLHDGCEPCRVESLNKQQAASAHKNILSNLERCGVPKRLRKFKMSDLSDGQQVLVKDFALGRIELLTLKGGVGVGKSVMAGVVCRELLLNCKYVKFIKLTDFFKLLRGEIDNKPTVSILDELRDVNYLVLDDIGAERVTDFMKDALANLVSHRYDEMKPTVFTTNLTLKEVGKLYDPRIASRMQHGEYVDIDGSDRRIC